MGRHRPDEDFIAYITDRMLWLRRIAFLLCQDWHQADGLAQTAITVGDMAQGVVGAHLHPQGAGGVGHEADRLCAA